jgi:hypothetical protein
METPLRIQKAKSAAMVISAIVFLFSLGINIFAGHETGFVEKANMIIRIPILIFASILSFRLHQKSPNKKEASQVWLMFGISLATFALAEIFVLIYLLAGRQPPNPGPFDIIYAFAYTSLFITLINIFRLFNIYPTRRSWIIFTGICVVVLILTGIFVMYPIARSVAESNPLETMVNAYYPLADFFILEIAIFLLFALLGKKVSSAWILICVGGLVFALVDVLFIYAEWNTLFYPGNRTNFISGFIDVGYLVVALLFVWGAFIQTKLNTVRPGELSPNGSLNSKG